MFCPIPDRSQTFMDTTEYINDFQITALLQIPLLNHHFSGNMMDREGSLHIHTHGDTAGTYYWE